jgi:hypothetical protein
VKVWLNEAEGTRTAECFTCSWSTHGGLSLPLAKRHAEEHPNHRVVYTATVTRTLELRETVDA